MKTEKSCTDTTLHYMDDFHVVSDEGLALMKRARSSSAPQAGTVAKLSINLTGIPFPVYQSLLAHIDYRQFLSRFALMSGDILQLEVVHPQPDCKMGINDDWKIAVDFDGFTEERNQMVENMWIKFRNWLLQFSATGRVKINERIDTREPGTYHAQVAPHLTLSDLANNLEADEDRMLFYLMANDKVDLRSLNWNQLTIKSLSKHKSEYRTATRASIVSVVCVEGQEDTIESQGSFGMLEATEDVLGLYLMLSAMNTVVTHKKAPRGEFELDLEEIMLEA